MHCSVEFHPTTPLLATGREDTAKLWRQSFDNLYSGIIIFVPTNIISVTQPCSLLQRQPQQNSKVKRIRHRKMEDSLATSMARHSNIVCSGTSGETANLWQQPFDSPSTTCKAPTLMKGRAAFFLFVLFYPTIL
jgi:hypothetical protein